MKTTRCFDPSMCDFHLCFHWVSKLMHVMNLSTYELLVSFRRCYHPLKNLQRFASPPIKFVRAKNERILTRNLNAL